MEISNSIAKRRNRAECDRDSLAGPPTQRSEQTLRGITDHRERVYRIGCVVDFRYQELMLQYFVKVLITAVVVVAVSELAKRSSFWGALLASLPLTSLLAFVWLYRSTGNVQAVASLSHGIFWLVLASLPLFLILPALLKNGVGFWPAFAASCAVTVGLYFGLVWVLGRVGVRL
ncbi:MAG: DUF3147 family protein [Burkholderiaceae bacterium]|nr:DUF3147 family protein [Burkholderiaceae bacterium]